MYEDKKVSVIVPIFNCDKYLNDSMGDVLRQTHKNIELILVNDGSTDNSAAICKQLAAEDSRVKIINKEKSEGAGPARNSGLSVAEGEYIMFLDSDDRIEPDMIEKLLIAVIKNNCQVAVCGYETYVEDVENGESDKIYSKQRVCKGGEVNEFFSENFPEGIVGYLWNKIYDAEVIRRNNLRFPDMRRLQDGVFNVDFFNCADSCCVIEDVLYHYRLNAQTDMFRKLPVNYYDLIKQFSESFISKYNKSTKIEAFFLNELGSCIENTFSVQWNMNKKARWEYCDKISNDEFFIDISKDINVINSKYRRMVIKLLQRKKYGVLLFLIKIKLFAKLRFKKLFYFLKRGTKK